MIFEEHAIKQPFAVIVGAASDFGREICQQFASKGFDLLISDHTEEIHQLKKDLIQYGTSIEGHQLDLMTFRGTEKLYEAIKSFGHPIDVLVINASTGPEGPFTQTDLKKEINVIHKNIVGPVHLLKKIINDMEIRGHGKILISSDSGPVVEAPYEAVYGATKAFLFSFTEALRIELRESGITITSILPNIFHLLTEEEQRHVADPKQLAIDAFDALMAGREHVFEKNIKQRIKTLFGRIIPDKAISLIYTSLS